MLGTGDYTSSGVAELFLASRPTLRRVVARQRTAA
jgi:hypothetical protein